MTESIDMAPTDEKKCAAVQARIWVQKASTASLLDPTAQDNLDISDQRLTVKNTFLHYIGDDDEQQDLCAMTRIYSAPTPECTVFSKLLRSDEPMKVRRIPGRGLPSGSLLGDEKWDVTSCLLEEADGSSVSCSWSTRTKSGESPGNNTVASAWDQSKAQRLPSIERFADQDMGRPRMDGWIPAERANNMMYQESSLTEIQKMFNSMPMDGVKDNYLHADDKAHEQTMQRYSTCPDQKQVPVQQPQYPMHPQPQYPANHGQNYAEPRAQEPRVANRMNLRPPGEVRSMSPISDTPSETQASRPWDRTTMVNVPNWERKRRPPPGEKFLCTFVIGIREDAQFTVSKRIIGRGGENMKFISSICTATKLRLRGRGSGFRERDTNAESDIALQINVSSPDSEEYELAKRELSSLLTTVYRDYKAMRGKDVKLKLMEHPRNPKK